MKKQSNLSRLLQSAGNHKYLTYASWVLSAISALIALVPFYYIWKVMQEVLAVAPDFSHAQNLTRNGWMAVLFAVIAVLVYIGALMCSHKGAFRIATNLRLQTMEHIVKLPLGFAEQFGSGRLRKIVNESGASASRPCQCHCDAMRPFGSATGVRLAAGTFEPCAGSAGLSDYDDDDRKENAGKNERIPKRSR